MDCREQPEESIYCSADEEAEFRALTGSLKENFDFCKKYRILDNQKDDGSNIQILSDEDLDMISAAGDIKVMPGPYITDTVIKR